MSGVSVPPTDEASRRFGLLAGATEDVVYETTLDNRILWMSASARRLMGWDPDGLVGTVATELVHPDDVAPLRSSRVQARTGARRAALEVRARDADGDYRWVAVSVTPIRDPAGEVTSLLAVLRDVDELVLLRAEAHAARGAMLAVLDAQPDPHLVLSAVRDGADRIVDFRYVAANQSAADALGVPRDLLVGATVLTLRPGVAASPLLRQYLSVVETGEPVELDGYAYEVPSGGTRLLDIRARKVGDGLSYWWRDVTDAPG